MPSGKENHKCVTKQPLGKGNHDSVSERPAREEYRNFRTRQWHLLKKIVTLLPSGCLVWKIQDGCLVQRNGLVKTGRLFGNNMNDFLTRRRCLVTTY